MFWVLGALALGAGALAASSGGGTRYDPDQERELDAANKRRKEQALKEEEDRKALAKEAERTRFAETQLQELIDKYELEELLPIAISALAHKLKTQDGETTVREQLEKAFLKADDTKSSMRVLNEEKLRVKKLLQQLEG